MLKKSWKRLAGYIAIELFCALNALAAGYDYNAGYAEFGQTKAIALEDRRGQRAVILTAAFSMPLSVSDSIAAQVIKSYHLERANLLLFSVASGDPLPQQALTSIGAALGKIEPAVLIFGDRRLTVSSGTGRCLAALTPQSSIEPCTTPAGDQVRSPIRSALQMVDLTQSLTTRDNAPRSVAIQAIKLGGSVIIFSAPEDYAQPNKRVILAVTPALGVEDSRVAEAVGQVFIRIGGRPR